MVKQDGGRRSHCRCCTSGYVSVAQTARRDCRPRTRRNWQKLSLALPPYFISLARSVCWSVRDDEQATLGEELNEFGSAPLVAFRLFVRSLACFLTPVPMPVLVCMVVGGEVGRNRMGIGEGG